MDRPWETILTPYVHPSRGAGLSIHKEHQLRSGLARRLIFSPDLRSALLHGVRQGRRFILKYAPKDW